jgi:uncharacterized protein (DUF1800 family)
VRRLFWRAGFGATKTEAAYWARRSKAQTINWLLNGGHGPKIKLPAPHAGGRRLDPTNEYGDDVLWWLDKMIRTSRPLQEKMTLFWHDHFATLDQDQPLQIRQNKMLRAHALGSFRALLQAVTKDTAMLLFLNGADSTKDEPNENYARELMELFTLGSGYTERDIREAARALTGFRANYDGAIVRTYYDKSEHDNSNKKIFGKRGNHDWRDVLDLCIDHPRHASFLVTKLWDFFIPTKINRSTRSRLVRIYRRSGHKIRPVLREILKHPALYRSLGSPDMVKSPVVYVAGTLRACREGVRRDDWVYLLSGMGQTPFDPPSVAGWDWGLAWLSTNSMHVRFDFANALLEGRRQVTDGSTPKHLTAKQSVSRAKSAVGGPWVSARTNAALVRLAKRLLSEAKPPPGVYKPPLQERADMCQRALRHLLISGPDAQVH